MNKKIIIKLNESKFDFETLSVNLFETFVLNRKTNFTDIKATQEIDTLEIFQLKELA